MAIPLTASAGTDSPKVLRVITDDNYPPYLFRNDDGAITGYLVDYWRLWESKTGVPVALTATRWAEAQRRILAGEADVIDMIYKTPSREPLYDFSPPYADLPVNIYSDQSISGITDISSLKGFLIGVQEGDACSEILDRHELLQQIRYPDYATLLAAARQQFKIFCLDQYPANFYLNKLGLDKAFRQAFTLYTGQFRRAVPKGQTATLNLVERGMAQISKEEKKQLEEKWFGVHVPKLGSPIDMKYFFMIFAATGTAAVVVLLWISILKRQVAAKTADLRQANADLDEGRQALLLSSEQLIASQTQLHVALQSADAGIWFWNTETGENVWSEEIWRLYGIKEGNQTLPGCVRPCSISQAMPSNSQRPAKLSSAPTNCSMTDRGYCCVLR